MHRYRPVSLVRGASLCFLLLQVLLLGLSYSAMRLPDGSVEPYFWTLVLGAGLSYAGFLAFLLYGWHGFERMYRAHFGQKIADVRERAEAEIAAREAQIEGLNLFETLVETVPEHIWYKDAKGRYQAVNRAYCQAQGWSAQAVIGRTDKELFSTRMAARYAEEDQRAARSSGPLEGDEWMDIPGKGKRLFSTLKIPHRDAEGRLLGVIGVSREMTARKQVEDDLRLATEIIEQKEALLRNLIDCTPDLIFLQGLDGKYILVNRAFSQAVGKTREQIVGRTPEEVFPVGVARLHRQSDAQVLADHTPIEYEFTLQWPGGRSARFSTIKTPYVDPSGVVTGVIGVARDVTERSEFEEQLRESEERYQLAVYGANDGLWDWDLRTDFVYYSPRWKAILGYEYHELPNDFDTWKRLIHPEDRSAVMNHLQAYLKGEVAHFNIEFRQQHKDGTSRWILARGAALRDKEGKPVRMAGSHSDITERKLATDALQQSEAKARAMAQKAEAANLAKSQFIATVSHDMRTPLNGIIGFLPLLGRGEIGEKERQYVRAISESAETLLALINDLLDLSKIEAGQMQLDHGPFDPRRALDPVVGTLAANAADKGVLLHHEILGEVPARVLGDVKRLRQVLFNIVGNAVKFTDSGQVMISLKAEPVAMEGEDILCLHFAVTDTGPGIAGEELDTIFQPFRQATIGGRVHHRGTGLGLAISKHLCQLMGGDIRVESEVGVGSTFRLYISVEAAEEEAGEEVSGMASGAGLRNLARQCPLSILVVDDALINREVMAATLNEMGYKVQMAEDGGPAVERCSEEDFDLVFMDFRMPGMDGKEASRRIRAHEKEHPERPPAYIVALTADAMKSDVDSAHEAGMDGYLTKPVQPDQIREVLEDAYEAKQRRERSAASRA